MKLIAFASLRQQPVTVDLAIEALRDRIRPTAAGAGSAGDGRGLSITTIQTAVAKAWGVSAAALTSKSRTREVAVPRQAAMLLSRELLNAHLADIGNAFGGRDHSTVIHSLERARYLRAADQEFAERLQLAVLELPAGAA